MGGSGNWGSVRGSGGSLRGALQGSLRGESEQASPTEIMVHWGAAKGDSVSFFSLEFAGATSTVTRTLKYKEIFRDPQDASPDSDFRYQRLVEGLQPGTSYAFRVRGFNGFGPGEYSYKLFTTRPAAPNTPVITTISSEAVTLRWVFSASFFRHIEELKRLFEDADIDKSGAVSREELTACLESGGCTAELKGFLNKIAYKIGLDVSQGYAALFDMMEGDDDGTLSWEEFETFFMSAGWAATDSLPSSVASVRASATGSVRASVTSLNTAASEGRSKGEQVNSLTYVVERCKNEFLDEYEEALKTGTFSHFYVHDLITLVVTLK